MECNFEYFIFMVSSSTLNFIFIVGAHSVADADSDTYNLYILPTHKMINDKE